MSDRRRGFTLVELLVAIGLVVLILSILTEAFSVGLQSFSKLKAIGDMSDRLRAASNQIRRDLAADHFEGSLRLSDPSFGVTRRPQAGFFVIRQFGGSVGEGASDGVTSYRSPSAPGRSHVLYFTSRLRGNDDHDFYTATVPSQFPMIAVPDRTTWYNQPADARRQHTQKMLYNSQWAEVAYFLMPSPDNATAKGTPLYSLHRMVRVLVADNRNLANLVPRNQEPMYQGFSYRPGTYLIFNTPWDVTSSWNRSLNQFIIARDPTAPTSPNFTGVESLLLTDVVSFTVQGIQTLGVDPWRGLPKYGYPLNTDFTDVNYDSSSSTGGLTAIRVTVRVWDLKTDQTRQISIVQDL
jgi:prepilin-type N-terminal cleavage/methylation domain-containing protein